MQPRRSTLSARGTRQTSFGGHQGSGRSSASRFSLQCRYRCHRVLSRETISAACVFVVREGRTVRTCEFILDKGLDVDEEELQSGFLKRYYDETADIPAEINLSVELEDAGGLGEWLAGKRERSCHLHRPQRGEKHRLLDMASKNARHALMRYMMRTGYADDRTNQALLELESALAAIAAVAYRSASISLHSGTFTVASMVVFTNGRADKSQYRRFKIQAELDEANDFVSMSEVLGRRYAPERRRRALWLAPRFARRRWR